MRLSILLSREAKDRIAEAILTGAGTAIFSSLAEWLINKAINHFDKSGDQPENGGEKDTNE